MTQETPILLAVEREEEIAHRPDCGIESIVFELEVLGEAETFRMDVAGQEARLSDIVPAARSLATKLSLLMISRLRREGVNIPCRKGCSACCCYLVPLSTPEAFRLSEEVLAMPSDRMDALLRSSLKAAKTILDGRFDDMKTCGAAIEDGRAGINRLGEWYAGLELECPFLHGNLCSCYEQRPVACREHMVTSAESRCGAYGEDEPSVVRMPASIVECLGKLAAELEQADVEAIMLPLALPWVQENIDRSQRTWPALRMVERFIEILKDSPEEILPSHTPLEQMQFHFA